MLSDWINDHETLLWWLGSISVATFIGALVAAPIVAVQMSPDYFMERRQTTNTLARRRPVLRWTGLVLKNLLGIILIIGGIAMLGLPGQGLLTIFLGLILTNYPGKRGLELRIIRLPFIHRAIDWVRKRYKHPPLQLPGPARFRPDAPTPDLS